MTSSARVMLAVSGSGRHMLENILEEPWYTRERIGYDTVTAARGAITSGAAQTRAFQSATDTLAKSLAWTPLTPLRIVYTHVVEVVQTEYIYDPRVFVEILLTTTLRGTKNG